MNKIGITQILHKKCQKSKIEKHKIEKWKIITTSPQYKILDHIVAAAKHAMSGNLKWIVEAGRAIKKINIYANTYFVLRNLTSVYVRFINCLQACLQSSRMVTLRKSEVYAWRNYLTSKCFKIFEKVQKHFYR